MPYTIRIFATLSLLLTHPMCFAQAQPLPDIAAHEQAMLQKIVKPEKNHIIEYCKTTAAYDEDNRQHENDETYTPEPCVETPLAEGRGEYYIQQLGTTADGNFILQEFYMPSGHKRSSPYEQPSINQSLSAGTRFGWYDNGQMYEYARYGYTSQMIEYVSWDEKGQKISESLFSDDEKTVGYDRDWYSNGQLQSQSHNRNGSIFGAEDEWYPNGQLKSHKDDAKENEGWSFEWYENGQMHMRAKNHQGQVVGVTTYWHPNGQKSHEIDPRTDEIVRAWDERGQRIKF